MSQSSFLEDVVCWSTEECQQRHTEAVPKLVSYFQQAENYHGKIGVLKILCQCFVPCMELELLEKSLFSQISTKVCDSFEKILNDVIQTVDKAQDTCSLEQLKEEIVALQDLLLDVLDCVEGTVRYLQGTDNSVELGHIHSLQPLTMHLLKTTFEHCKDSANIYQELITVLSEPLSCLFRKAYSLQLAFLGLLDKIVIGYDSSEEDVQDLCAVCEGLYRISQVVTSLDVKISITLWKAISKYVTQHKLLLRERLDLASMVIYLCTEIQTGYSYLFTIVPQLDDYGQPLTSQGDEKAFMKSVKILGFQMKVLVMLIKEYQGYLADCERSVYILLLQLHKMQPPSLSAPCLQSVHQEEIQRQLMNATEPIMTHILDSDRFTTCLTSTDTGSSEDISLAQLQLQVSALGILPGMSEEIEKKWIDPKVYPEDEPREGIIEAVFTSVEKCFIELSSKAQLPGVMCSGNAQRSVSLYEHVCTRLCGFIGSIPAKHFHILESCLLNNVLSSDPFCAQLAMDVWCFVSRYGSADLCLGHVTFLCEILSDLPYNESLEYRNVSRLLSRMVTFMAPQHQEKLLSLCSPAENLTIWSVIPIWSFPQQLCMKVVQEVIPCCIESISSWMNRSDKCRSHLKNVNVALRVLCNIYKSASFPERISPELQGLVIEKYCGFWHCLPALPRSDCLLCLENIQLILQLGGFLVHLLQTKDILQMVYVTGQILQEYRGMELKLSVCNFLKHCAKLKMPPSFEQTRVLSRIPQLFFSMLSHDHCVVQHNACEAFASFAEDTPHEMIVPECLQNSEVLQSKVMKYVNKNTGHETSIDMDLVYLKAQKAKLEEFKKKTPVEKLQQIKDRIVDEIEITDTMETEKIVDIPSGADTKEEETASKRMKMDGLVEQIEEECKGLVKSTQNNMSRLLEIFESGELPCWVIDDLSETSKQLTKILKNRRDDG